MYYGRPSDNSLKCIMVAYLTTTYMYYGCQSDGSLKMYYDHPSDGSLQMYYGRPSDGSFKCIMAAHLTAA